MKKIILILFLSFSFFFTTKSNAIQLPTTYGGQIISLQEYQQYMDYCFYAYWMILDDVYNFNNESSVDLNYRLYGVEGGEMVLGFGEHILKCYTEQGVLQKFSNSGTSQLGKYNNTLKRGMSDRCLGIDWFDGNWFVYACNPETGAWHIIPNSVGGSANDRAGTYDCVNTKTWKFYGGSSYLNLVINKKKVFGVNYDESYYYRTFACVETDEHVEINPTLTQLKVGLTTSRVSSDIGSTTGTGGSTGGTGTSDTKLDEIKTQLAELNNTNSSFQTQNLGKISEVKSEILLTNEQIAVNQNDLTTKLNILESKNDLLKADLVEKMNLSSATSELNNQNLNTKIDENNVNLLSQIEENDSKISSLQNSLDDYTSDSLSLRNSMLTSLTDIESQLDGIENSLNGSGVDLTDTNQGITNIDSTLKSALLDDDGKSYLVCSFLFINIETILYILGSNEDLTNISIEYMSILLLFLPFLMIGVVLDYFVRVDGRPNLAFIALLSSGVINVVLDWFLIVYLEKGIFGAALATGISELALIFILLPHFFSKKATLKFVKPIGSYIEIVKAAYNGASEFINEMSVGITILIFNYIMIKTFSVEGVSAFAIINYLLWIGIMISYGISDSLQPLISKNFGAKEDKRIENFLKIAFITTSFVGFLMIILILFIPEQLANLFLEDSNSETKQLVLDFAKFIWIAFLFNGANLILSAYFTAVHKPLQSIFIAISRSLIFPVIFIATLPFVFDKNGIFLAIPMAEALTFIIAIILFKKKSKY